MYRAYDSYWAIKHPSTRPSVACYKYLSSIECVALCRLLRSQLHKLPEAELAERDLTTSLKVRPPFSG
jgi:hypothetical protein